jgi:pyruvate ferredoxin oxidoreductase alpha subunit
MQALALIPEVAAEFRAAFGRDSGGLVRPYRVADAETVVIALGSVLGTIKDTVDELREAGIGIGALGICSFRPFPLAEVRDALAGAKRVVVLERAFAVGIGGIVASNVRMALGGLDLACFTVIAGLGGRPVTKASLHRLLADAVADRLEPLTFLDLNRDVVARELERAEEERRSGPIAENILRELGIVAARLH